MGTATLPMIFPLKGAGILRMQIYKNYKTILISTILVLQWLSLLAECPRLSYTMDAKIYVHLRDNISEILRDEYLKGKIICTEYCDDDKDLQIILYNDLYNKCSTKNIEDILSTNIESIEYCKCTNIKENRENGKDSCDIVRRIGPEVYVKDEDTYYITIKEEAATNNPDKERCYKRDYKKAGCKVYKNLNDKYLRLYDLKTIFYYHIRYKKIKEGIEIIDVIKIQN